MIQLGNFFVAMASWNEPIKSLVFSSLSCFIIFRFVFIYISCTGILLNILDSKKLYCRFRVIIICLNFWIKIINFLFL